MGEAAIRITAQDFLTPPEFADLRLAASGAGRIGGLRLSLAGRPARLTACYQQVPLRVLALDLGPVQPSFVYVLNPTAGLFDGDAQLVDVDVRPESRVFITGQSATRIHPCLSSFGTQQWRLRVGPGAIAVVLPGPAIPFQDCRYYQRAEIELAESAHLIWGDVWLPGRYARGQESERFQFRTLIQDFSVRRGNHLLFRDRFCWQGPWPDATAAWHFGAADAYGTLFSTITDSGTPERDFSCDTKKESKVPRRASFRTAAGHTCLRWLGSVQAVIGALTHTAWRFAALADNQDQPWLLAAHDLAPNHWFT